MSFITLTGKMSTFGGPKDKGVSPSEDLALVFNQATFNQARELFLADQPPGTTGYARRLNPDAFYLACRWNYAQTSKAYLLSITVTVRNPANGRELAVRPVDWGPNEETTGRVADLSPGTARFLGLNTDDPCEVIIPLPAPAPAAVRGATKAVTRTAAAAPSRLHVLSPDQIRAEFGDFSWKDDPNERGAIIISPPWEKQNITTVTIPQLNGVRIDSTSLTSKGRIEFHKKAAQDLQDAFAEVERQGLLPLIRTWGGSFVPRHITWNPAKGLSSHSWGIAFDINVRWNGYGVTPPGKGEEGSVVELVPIFESFGFAWGGFFSTADGMHFEYCRTTAAGGAPAAIPAPSTGSGHSVLGNLFHNLFGTRSAAPATRSAGTAARTRSASTTRSATPGTRPQFVTAVWFWNNMLPVAVKQDIGAYEADPQGWLQKVSALTMEQTFISSPPGTNAGISSDHADHAARLLVSVCTDNEHATFNNGGNNKTVADALSALMAKNTTTIANIADAVATAFTFP